MRGKEAPLQPPVENINDIASDYEIAALKNQLGTSIVGSPQTVKEKLEKFLDESQADKKLWQSPRFTIIRPASIPMKYWLKLLS
ncbi:hypothetical protein [Peribacillus saganii]|uniref:hypothetical protein n=1 Tax=Peribacillus saganii TaxID=2303992 RepID=UPI001F471437|nr:hypothetical protein [Peribacillus saganii]